MKVEMSVLGSWQRIKLVPENDVEKTFLHNLVNQLPHSKTRSPSDKIFVSDAVYGFVGLQTLLLTNTTPVTEW